MIARQTIPARRDARLLAGLLLLLVSLSSAAHAWAEVPRKRVLLVYNTDGSLPANLEFEQSLVDNLHAAVVIDLEFYREQLDSARFPEYKERRIEEFRSRYTQRKIDVVIFFGAIPAEILPGVPVVQVDNGTSEPVIEKTYRGNAILVSWNLDARKTVDAARRLHPGARKVLLISGAAAGERVEVDQFRQRLIDEPNLDVEVVDYLSVADLCARVARLPKDVIVLPVTYFRDPEGNTYLPRDVIAKLAAVSTAPVYGTSDTLVGRGPVGGYVIDWQKAGEVTADAVMQILDGKSPSQVVLKSPGSGVYMFDWRQLKRWGFSEDDLPPGSTVKFKVPTAWEQYRWRIVAIGVLIIAQTLLTVALLIQRRKRRRAEESLHDMAGRLLQSQDDERRRIARDLHDGTGQHLSGIALSLGQVLADFPNGYVRLRQLLQDSHVASRQALNEVRAVSYALHPPILDGLRLVPALQWYLDGLQKRTSFSIDFDAPADILDCPPDAERALFRIVQESITNGMRHSGGTAMKVALSNRPEGIVLEITDNGRGLSTEELEAVEGAASFGVGIAGMRERVRQLHGTFEISSSPRGTRVLVYLPILGKKYATHSAGR